MENETPYEPEAQERPDEIELTPKPRIKKLSSAIVWIAAIFAVAVLWVVGYLVSSKAQRPTAERRTTSLAPPVEDLAERIQRAAEREARIAAERAAAERAKQLAAPPPLPPGFEELLAQEPEPSARDFERRGGSGRARPAREPKEQALQRAFDSEIVPAAFRTVAPRVESDPRANLGAGPPAMLDLAALREELRRGVEGREETTEREAPEDSERSPARVEPNGSPFRLTTGTLIPAVLTTGINSDLPGQTTALVRRNVYDSITGRYLLIPQGTRLVGEYDSRVAYGQSRVLVAWNRLIFPDGRSLDLRGMPGTDLAAATGLHDKVNNHFVRTFGSALMLAAVSAGVQLSQPAEDTSFRTSPTPSQIAAAAVGQELGRVSAEYLRRNMDVRPTLEVRPGYELNVEVTSDVVLDGPYRVAAGAGR